MPGQDASWLDKACPLLQSRYSAQSYVGVEDRLHHFLHILWLIPIRPVKYPTVA